ncbi:dynamin family protein [Neobacillus sp. LXY-1]|uniref:dynamin family protein n=1 Tax=Neobacillus sp. LXY-1 TaxID=3379133 RepID=UPI003EE0B0D5
MVLEEQLKNKTYYTMFINEHDSVHPIQALGEAFLEEAQKDLPDLSNIRFAQGEVYFHHKDYEAAIFKWENIQNELGSWAKKNIADAYYELGILPNAEDLYTAIKTTDSTLTTEVALKLFSLYIERDKMEAAVSVIKKTIADNPDYPNVTDIARAFFEERLDWGNAVELAVNEAKRTENIKWFDILHSYVDKGMTNSFAPSYFSHALFILFHSDQQRFESLVASIWNSYQEDASFTWMKEVNHLLLNLDLERTQNWVILSDLHRETFYQLINGDYFIKDLQEYIPDLLTNWLRLADSKNQAMSSAAVLTWDELFPNTISSTIVKEAENLIRIAKADLNEFEESLTLLHSITQWARANEMEEDERVSWLVDQLFDFDTQHLLVVGMGGSGKSTFINTILGEPLQDSPTPSTVMFRHSEELDIKEITVEERMKLAGFSEFQERMDRLRNAQESIIEYRLPSQLLQEQAFALIDTPALKGNDEDRYGVLKTLQVADIILFVLDANAPLIAKERTILTQIQQLAPDIPIHFVLSKMDTIPNEQDAIRILDEISLELHAEFSDSKVFAFSSQYDRSQQLSDLKIFIESIKMTRHLKDKRLAKVLYFIRATIASLLQKRIDLENRLVEAVRWNEDMYLKLNGSVNQLDDTITQKIKEVSSAFFAVKEPIKQEINESVPNILRECGSLINEESDFGTILNEVNQEMNLRLQAFLEQLLPKYYSSLQEWIKTCEEGFVLSQQYLDELSDGFNRMYGEERLKLNCDFKVVEDWHRDTDRMTSRFQLDPLNIVLKRTPSQFLLKSAGKLFGAFSQNKTVVYNKYKAFIENEDYSEIAAVVSKQFFQAFELFEKSFERDVNLFFKNPMNVLTSTVEATRSEIETNKDILEKMNEKPELFRDPLTLFELRLRQFEWMTVAGNGIQTVY